MKFPVLASKKQHNIGRINVKPVIVHGITTLILHLRLVTSKRIKCGRSVRDIVQLSRKKGQHYL